MTYVDDFHKKMYAFRRMIKSSASGDGCFRSIFSEQFVHHFLRELLKIGEYVSVQTLEHSGDCLTGVATTKEGLELITNEQAFRIFPAKGLILYHSVHPENDYFGILSNELSYWKAPDEMFCSMPRKDAVVVRQEGLLIVPTGSVYTHSLSDSIEALDTVKGLRQTLE